MDMIYIGIEADVFNYFKLIVNRDFNFDVKSSTSPEDAISMLKKTTVSVLIIDLEQEKPEVLFDYLKQNDLKVPILFTGDNNTISKCHKYIKHHPLTSRVSYNSNEKVVSRSIERLLNISTRFDKEKMEMKGLNKSLISYCALPIGFFKIDGIVESSIYYKNAQGGYDLLIESNQKMPGGKIVGLMGAGVTHLYLLAEEYLVTTSSFMKKLSIKLKPKEMKVEQLNLVSTFSHDSICKLIPELGLKDEILEMASLALNNIKEVMSRDSNLSLMAKKILKGKGYNSEHSMFLVFLTTAIVRETEWNSPDSISKLTLASFFHDIFVEEGSERFALSDNIEKIKSGVSGQFFKNYFNHPKSAADMLSKLEDIPSDVNKIIIEHHEKMDGTGFPRGHDWKTLSPLSVVFIVAEDFVNCIYEAGDSIEFMGDILDELENKYDRGNFKKAVLSLRTALALPRLPKASDQVENTVKIGA